MTARGLQLSSSIFLRFSSIIGLNHCVIDDIIIALFYLLCKILC